MTLPSVAEFLDAMEETWPAAERQDLPPWIIRRGAGGGKRVSAATAAGSVTDSDVQNAAEAMRDLGQRPLFMVREGEDELDQMLDRLGYRVVDPVVIYACPVATVAATPPEPVSAFLIWPPLALMREIWAAGGVTKDRVAVMERVASAKTCLFSRRNDRAAGCGFVAVSGDIAMLHALEVAENLRHRGAAINMMRLAAKWAQDNGAKFFSLAVTRENSAANTLYSKLGMVVVGKYHYRTSEK